MSTSASSFALEPVSFTPKSDAMRLSFRLPSASSSPPSARISPATALQFSFANGGFEAFAERLTARDVSVDDGLCHVQLPGSEIPKFTSPAGQTSVSVHAWKGEKWLGKWEVGTL
jgi:hypothetical protein